MSPKRTAPQQEDVVTAEKKQKTVEKTAVTSNEQQNREKRRLAEDDYHKKAKLFLNVMKWVTELFDDSNDEAGTFGVVATEQELTIDTHNVIPVYARIEMTPEDLEKVETHDLEQITKDIEAGKRTMYANAEAYDFIAQFDETCCDEDTRKRSQEDGYYENLERGY